MAATVVVVLFLLLSFSVFVVSCNDSVLRLSKNNLARDLLLLMNVQTLLPSIAVLPELASLNILRNPRKCAEREVHVIHTVVSTIDNEFQSKKKKHSPNVAGPHTNEVHNMWMRAKRRNKKDRGTARTLHSDGFDITNSISCCRCLG